MPLRRLAVTVFIATATLAACGSSSTTDTGGATASVDGDVVAVGAAPAPTPPGDGVGSIGDAVEVAAGAPGEASVASCAVDHQTLQMAVETYELLNGALPTSQQELVDARVIQEPSVYFEITPEGALVPGPGSPCT